MNPPPLPDPAMAAELARLRTALAEETASRERLEQMLQDLGEGYWNWDPASDRLCLSPALRAQLGLPAGDGTIRGEEFLALVHSDDVDIVRDLVRALLHAKKGAAPSEGAFRLGNPAGKWCWTRVRAMADIGDDGRVRHVAGMHADISSLKETELSARALESRYRLLYDAAPVALIMWNPQGQVIEWNRHAEKLFGWSSAQVHGRRFAEQLVAADEHQAYAEMARRAVAENRLVELSTNCRDRDGKSIRCHWYSLPLRQEGALAGLMTLAFDITEQYQNEQQLELYRDDLERLVNQRTMELALAHQSLSQIIDSSPVPAFVLDAKHQVSHWNRACEKILGMPAADVVGSNEQWRAFYAEPRPVLADLVMSGNRVQMAAIYGSKLQASLVVPGAVEVEEYFPAIGRWLFFTAAAIRDGEGRVIGAIETLQDVTARKQAEMALLEAKAEAEAAARVKAEFLANMSHEIRTPLNAIIGLGHLLQKSELTRKQQEHVAHLRTAGDMLLQLISDILDFSKIEAGKMPIEKAPFVLDQVLDNLSAMVGERARDKGLELHFVLDSDVPQHLVGDSLRLTQVLINLLSNAIKFTDHGQIVVFISVAERGNAMVRLEVAVQDTGIGLTPEQRTRLFRAFSQADSLTARKYGGTGLGLTICNRLLELMGGSITVASEQGIGSTFLFDVPLGVGEEGEAPATVAQSLRALVVDDNPIARTVLSRILEKLGYRVAVADSGEAALAIAADAGGDPFQLAFLDWNMPHMNGAELARRLRSEIAPAPRIVVVTSAGQSEAEAAFTEAKVNGLVFKPVSATSLAAAIAELTSPAAPLPPPVAAQRLKGLRVLLVDDVATNRLIASEILEDEGAVVGEAENGREAVDLVLRSGPWDVVLMDVQMPEMNGLEATAAIHGDPRFSGLPIIAMTAFALEEERERCLAAGMNGFLTKPIEPEKVIATLAEVAVRRGRAAPTSTAPGSGAAAPAVAFPSLPGIDTVDGLRRMMNKPAFYEKMLKSFHDRFVNAPATVRAHLTAGRLEEARREAHSAKGVAASVSANRLRDQALRLEQAIAAGHADVDAEIGSFAAALDEVLAGLRRQFGWPPLQ